MDPGGVTEWTKVRDWKSRVRQRTVGSNPTLSAILRLVAVGDGRAPATGTREPRQAWKGATVVGTPGALDRPAITCSGD